MKTGIALRRRDQIICLLKAAMPESVTVKKHGGEIDAVQLAKYGADAPCLVVTVMAIGGVDRQDRSGDVGFGIFVVTSDKALQSNTELDRTDQALVLGEGIVALMTGPLWSPQPDPDNPQPSDCGQGPKDIVATNLFDDDIDDEGLAMWGVLFTENAELAANTFANLYDLETLWTGVVPPSDPDTTTPSIEFDALPDIP